MKTTFEVVGLYTRPQKQGSCKAASAKCNCKINRNDGGGKYVNDYNDNVDVFNFFLLICVADLSKLEI